MQQQVFERGFVQWTAERGTQRPHELVGSQFEIAGAMSVERAGRVALDQGAVEVKEGSDSPTAGPHLNVLDELIDRDHRRCRTGHLILTSSPFVVGQAARARSL